jgi:hypothetical protein
VERCRGGIPRQAVVNLQAAPTCEATPERADERGPACEPSCDACAKPERRRKKGRGVEGPGGDVAETVLASVREIHVA